LSTVFLSDQIRLKRDDLGTPYYLPPRQGAPAEGWPPSALLLIFITLQPDWISHEAAIFKTQLHLIAPGVARVDQHIDAAAGWMIDGQRSTTRVTFEVIHGTRLRVFPVGTDEI